MPGGSRYIRFEGLLEEQVLGVFTIIRGFADLKLLAEVSKPFQMVRNTDQTRVVGHQRPISEQHAQRIKRYLESSDIRFLPEVILSIRTDFQAENNAGEGPREPDGISIRRKGRSKSNPIYQVVIDRRALPQILEGDRIRRIDGNHRLDRAPELADDPAVSRKYIASFCMIVLQPPGIDYDDYAESLVFHTINSTALSLESEHALALILGQHDEYRMAAEDEFSYDPVLHLTRLLRDWAQNLPRPARIRLADRLTALSSAARSMIDLDPNLASDYAAFQEFSNELFAGLTDITTRLRESQPSLCQAEYFTDLAARVWKGKEGLPHEERVNAVLAYLNSLGTWLGHEGFTSLKSNGTLSEQLLQIYESVRHRVPKKVFLARWYPATDDGGNFHRANLRLVQLRRTLQDLHDEYGVSLELVDMGTRTGGTFMIHPVMYEAVESADIILIDLTGVRPNVCVEAGYALKHHEKGRLIFIHHRGHELPDVPFDLSTFRYEPFDDTAEIPDRIRPHILSILRSAGLDI